MHERRRMLKVMDAITVYSKIQIMLLVTRLLVRWYQKVEQAIPLLYLEYYIQSIK